MSMIAFLIVVVYSGGAVGFRPVGYTFTTAWKQGGFPDTSLADVSTLRRMRIDISVNATHSDGSARVVQWLMMAHDVVTWDSDLYRPQDVFGTGRYAATGQFCPGTKNVTFPHPRDRSGNSAFADPDYAFLGDPEPENRGTTPAYWCAVKCAGDERSCDLPGQAPEWCSCDVANGDYYYRPDGYMLVASLEHHGHGYMWLAVSKTPVRVEGSDVRGVRVTLYLPASLAGHRMSWTVGDRSGGYHKGTSAFVLSERRYRKPKRI